jgi:hypothetical protein
MIYHGYYSTHDDVCTVATEIESIPSRLFSKFFSLANVDWGEKMGPNEIGILIINAGLDSRYKDVIFYL